MLPHVENGNMRVFFYYNAAFQLDKPRAKDPLRYYVYETWQRLKLLNGCHVFNQIYVFRVPYNDIYISFNTSCLKKKT